MEKSLKGSLVFWGFFYWKENLSNSAQSSFWFVLLPVDCEFSLLSKKGLFEKSFYCCDCEVGIKSISSKFNILSSVYFDFDINYSKKINLNEHKITNN